MSAPDSNDVPTEPLDTDSEDTTPEAQGKADNSGAVGANEPDPDLSLIEPAAD